MRNYIYICVCVTIYTHTHTCATIYECMHVTFVCALPGHQTLPPLKYFWELLVNRLFAVRTVHKLALELVMSLISLILLEEYGKDSELPDALTIFRWYVLLNPRFLYNVLWLSHETLKGISFLSIVNELK